MVNGESLEDIKHKVTLLKFSFNKDLPEAGGLGKRRESVCSGNYLGICL